MRRAENIVFIGSFLLILLGCVVMFGWLTYIPYLFQFSRKYTPMVFNTALAMSVTGIAILLTKRYTKIAAVLGLILVIFAIETFAEYILSVNLGTDELSQRYSDRISTENF